MNQTLSISFLFQIIETRFSFIFNFLVLIHWLTISSSIRWSDFTIHTIYRISISRMGRTSYQNFEDWRFCVPYLMSQLCFSIIVPSVLDSESCCLYSLLHCCLYHCSILFFFPVACSVNQSRRSFSFCFLKWKISPLMEKKCLHPPNKTKLYIWMLVSIFLHHPSTLCQRSHE